MLSNESTILKIKSELQKPHIPFLNPINGSSRNGMLETLLLIFRSLSLPRDLIFTCQMTFDRTQYIFLLTFNHPPTLTHPNTLLLTSIPRTRTDISIFPTHNPECLKAGRFGMLSRLMDEFRGKLLPRKFYLAIHHLGQEPYINRRFTVQHSSAFLLLITATGWCPRQFQASQ